ncbi:hypothetical protein [Kitasatospora sp. NPDC058218]|uniref:hypothetical protein n=1 Tax=Kitasatospora sp. NPDC058218 TaxID=3346385 RepID=UPI0036D88186
MSLAEGKPASEEAVEVGLCPNCELWVRGRWIEDLTPHTALVEHDDCPAAED